MRMIDLFTLLALVFQLSASAQNEKGNGGDVSEIEVKLSILDLGSFFERNRDVFQEREIATKFYEGIRDNAQNLTVTLVESREALGEDRTCLSPLNQWKIKCVRKELIEARHLDLGLYYAILAHEVGRIIGLENTDSSVDTPSTYPYSPRIAAYGPEIRALRKQSDATLIPQSLIESGFVCSDRLGVLLDGGGSFLALKTANILISHPGGSFTYLDFKSPRFASAFFRVGWPYARDPESLKQVQRAERAGRREVLAEMLAIELGKVAKARVLAQGRWETGLDYYFKSKGIVDRSLNESFKSHEFLSAFDLGQVLPANVFRMGHKGNFLNEMTGLKFELAHVSNPRRHYKGKGLACSFNPRVYSLAVDLTSGSLVKRTELDGNISFSLPKFIYNNYLPRWVKSLPEGKTHSIRKNLPKLGEAETRIRDRRFQEPLRRNCRFYIDNPGQQGGDAQWDLVKKVLRDEKGYTIELKRADFNSDDEFKEAIETRSSDFITVEAFFYWTDRKGLQLSLKHNGDETYRHLFAGKNKSKYFKNIDEIVEVGVVDKVRRLVPACGTGVGLND